MGESRKVLILGAGVIGVTTAYLLGARGFSVEVIERHDEAARETSFLMDQLIRTLYEFPQE